MTVGLKIQHYKGHDPFNVGILEDFGIEVTYSGIKSMQRYTAIISDVNSVGYNGINSSILIYAQCGIITLYSGEIEDMKVW